ncbi:MAG: hypothetical protein KF805_04865 [Phycisphaeraceae bacterium]|nr:hypothetical protein [Phycisphaeraceae bacterium]
MRHQILFATLLMLGGCTMSYTDPPLSFDNPANPAAAASPPPARSSTLDLAAADLVPPMNPTKSMDHSDHGMGNMSMPQAPDSGTSIETQTSAENDTSSNGAAVTYACPMHPEVTSNKPDQRCSKCGMQLQPAPTAPQGEPK